MIDIHSHLLSDLDDGFQNLQQSVAALAEAAGQGVETIFATPHCCDGVYDCHREDILSAWQDLRDAAASENLDIQVLPGAEIRVNHDLVERFDAGDLLTLGDAGRYLLLELPPMFIAGAVMQLIRQLRERGIICIIAHAERNPMIGANPELAMEFQFQDAKLQVTAGSLTGDFGKPVARFARTLVENDLVFCLGSDLHPGRKYRMKAAQKKLTRWIGPEKTRALMTQNPGHIVKPLSFHNDNEMTILTKEEAL